ncbi:hypothetical protein I302_102240 [Kwoniella bestiolae CBS 10118]|uniref:Uncharacterized protein n=1 Tax=Kwoniella bestiolae CBS 10118 TaxID=1296100 RepID=A0A1B9GEH1_9TREE|nr:hypothetical protein I302_00929 [Kwoniella bestiolae CBS 10118]OCF29424.1 hypothetical protein I302_00929 [Kwoniella bestiolae CBS 10118]
MTLLAKPSRSYANVDHDASGLSSVGNAPYGSSSSTTSNTKKLLKKDKDPSRVEGGFKTYRPPLAETHLRRPLGYDPHPDSHFAPLPPAFHLGGKHKKDAALAGQRAELEHILQPEYKSTYNYDMDDSSSIAGPSRNHLSSRTAGGLDRKGKSPMGIGSSALRPSTSISSFHQTSNGTSNNNGGGRKSGAGVYIDSNGKLHDTEFDPFGHISEMSRAKSRRRSAFGSDRRKSKNGDSSSSSESGSDVQDNNYIPRRSTDTTGREREEEEIRKRLEMERKRLDDVSGYAAARRRSMMSERSGSIRPSTPSEDGGGAGPGAPSIYTTNSTLAPTAMSGRSRSQHGVHYVPSPLSPTFSVNHTPSVYSRSTQAHTPQTASSEHKVQGTPPEKTTENTSVTSSNKLRKEPTKSRVEVSKDGSKKITGFDAPVSPIPPYTPIMETGTSVNGHLLPHAPLTSSSGRLSPAPPRGSIDSKRERVPKPAERPREELFPETPAQIKRREERERRMGVGVGVPSASSGSRVNRGLSVDTGRDKTSRILPEIEIVEDDDPRIIFPPEGKTTKIQSKHDHVIKGPFSLALNAGVRPGSDAGDYPDMGGRRGSASRSIGGGSGHKPPSTLVDEDGGYLPSRWASGDKSLRTTEGDRERYRPMEWVSGGGAEIVTRNDEWHPSTKDQFKRNMKDIATSARFSLFRTKKKLLRKAEM